MFSLPFFLLAYRPYMMHLFRLVFHKAAGNTCPALWCLLFRLAHRRDKNALINDVYINICVLQHRAAGGEDPESFGPASEGRQRLLWPLREDLPTARQEEEIPDQGASHSQNTTHLTFPQRKHTHTHKGKQNQNKPPPSAWLLSFSLRRPCLPPHGESLHFH